jgi:hypothetical protein
MKIKKILDYRFNTRRNPNWSILFIIAVKFLIAIQFILQSLKYIRGLCALLKLKEYRNSGKNSFALVLGNGPIADELPYDLLKDLNVKKNFYVYGVNFILNSKIADKLKVDYLILSDPETLDLESKNERVHQLWIKIKQCKPTIFIPFSYYNEIKNFEKFTSEIYFFNDLSLETISHNINPLLPRGYLSSTLLKALAIALYANHKHIFITGADQSMFTKVSVNKSNRIIQFPTHHLGAEGGHDNHLQGIDVTDSYFNGLADYLYDMSSLQLAFRRYFRRQNRITYLGNSLHDFYRKITTEEFSKKITRPEIIN